MFPWRQDFDNLVYRTLDIFTLYIETVHCRHFHIFYTILEFIYWFSLFLSQFERLRFRREIEKFIMAAVKNQCRNYTSCDLIVLYFEHFKRKQFWKYYLQAKFHCHNVDAT